MKANKSPAFQFYPADFLSDANVALMNDEQIGIYIRLMCHCWLEGSIPNDIEKIARLCRRDGQAIKKVWPEIRVCFGEDAEGERLIHPRLEKERSKQRARKDSLSEAGKKGALNRWSEEPDGEAMATPSEKNGRAIQRPLATPMASDSLSSSFSSSTSSSPSGKKEKINKKKKSEIFRNDPKWTHFKDQNFKQLYLDYLTVRKEKRKPPTERAELLILEKLHKQDFKTACLMLSNSIENSWTGVFEPKGGTNGTPSGKTGSQTEWEERTAGLRAFLEKRKANGLAVYEGNGDSTDPLPQTDDPGGESDDHAPSPHRLESG